MPDQETSPANVEEFIARWSNSQAAERANYQLFLSELCDVLSVGRPEPARGGDAERNAYVYERAVLFNDGEGRTSSVECTTEE